MKKCGLVNNCVCRRRCRLKSEVKSALRYTAILDGSYVFAPVVDEERRQWWKEVATRFLDGMIRNYSYNGTWVWDDDS